MAPPRFVRKRDAFAFKQTALSAHERRRWGERARAKIVEPAELVLPDEPAVTKEELSDDPINDVA